MELTGPAVGEVEARPVSPLPTLQRLFAEDGPPCRVLHLNLRSLLPLDALYPSLGILGGNIYDAEASFVFCFSLVMLYSFILCVLKSQLTGSSVSTLSGSTAREA